LIFDELRYKHIGRDSLFARIAGSDISEECLGRRYDYDPAQDAYSRSVCRDYASVLRENRPSYDHICARIQIATHSKWLMYQRFVAPFTLPDERPILAVLCDPTQDVSIPFPSDGVN
jgi:hypothetical protein